MEELQPAVGADRAHGGVGGQPSQGRSGDLSAEAVDDVERPGDVAAVPGHRRLGRRDGAGDGHDDDRVKGRGDSRAAGAGDDAQQQGEDEAQGAHVPAVPAPSMRLLSCRHPILLRSSPPQ
jgi:hypothetical protein